MGNRYHVAKSVMTIGEAEFDMDVGPAAKGQTREACEVTSLGDFIKQFIPGALIEEDEFTVTIFDPGPEGRPSVSDEPAAVSFEVVLSRGRGSSDDVSADFEYASAIITKVSPPQQNATGDRKATIDVTIRPDGTQEEEATTTPAAGSGTTTPAAGSGTTTP